MSTGFIEIIAGPMFSSKSTTLLGRLGCDAAIGRNVLYINHSSDVRSTDNEPFSTHNQLYKNSKLSAVNNLTATSLGELPAYKHVKQYHTIGIDEAQFFTNLFEVVNYAEKNGSRVIVAGLVGNAKRETFGDILSLVPKADKFELLHASCVKCAATSVESGFFPSSVPAPFTCKIAGDKEQTIDVGGIDKYIPVCRKHYLELNENSKYGENDKLQINVEEACEKKETNHIVWICKECEATSHIFALNCNRCGRVRNNPNAESDWMCLHCNFKIFASKDKCNKCGSRKRDWKCES